MRADVGRRILISVSPCRRRECHAYIYISKSTSPQKMKFEKHRNHFSASLNQPVEQLLCSTSGLRQYSAWTSDKTKPSPAITLFFQTYRNCGMRQMGFKMQGGNSEMSCRPEILQSLQLWNNRHPTMCRNSTRQPQISAAQNKV